MTPFRPLILLTLTLFSMTAFSLSTFSQDTTYFDLAWKRTPSRPTDGYYRLTAKTDSGWAFTDYTITNTRKIKTGLFADDSLKISKGVWKWYGKTGTMEHFCTYVNDSAEGPEAYYYPDGKLQAYGNNKSNDADGEWISYYPSGKRSGRTIYVDGKETASQFFNEDGTPNTSATIFMRDASFPGGSKGFLQFLNSTFKYPKSAIKREIQGVVLVQFKVTKEGRLEDITVIHSVEKSLDEEALRVIHKSPDWVPAIIGGLPVEAYRKQPIVFRLE